VREIHTLALGHRTEEQQGGEGKLRR
jgi:hypothetical protein